MVELIMQDRYCVICNKHYRTSENSKQETCGSWCQDKLVGTGKSRFMQVKKRECENIQKSNSQKKESVLVKDTNTMRNTEKSEKPIILQTAKNTISVQENVIKQTRKETMKEEKNTDKQTQKGPESTLGITINKQTVKIASEIIDTDETQLKDCTVSLCNSGLVQLDTMKFIDNSVKQMNDLADSLMREKIPQLKMESVKVYAEMRNMMRLKLDTIRLAYEVNKKTKTRRFDEKK